MRVPEYNHYFTGNEYALRIEKIRSAMLRWNLDAVILAQASNVDYAAGVLHSTWMHGFNESKLIVIITADSADEPILLAPEGLRGNTMTCPYSDIRILADESFESYSKETIRVLAEKKLLQARIGFEIKEDERMGMTPGLYNRIITAIPQAKISDCADMMYCVRMIKTEAEIRCVRKAVEITCQSLQDTIPMIHEGMSEQEYANLLALRMAELNPDTAANHPWFLFVYADGKSPISWDGIPGDYRFKKGDCIYIDIGARYHGYTADMIRVVSIGDPDPKKARHYYAARDLNMEIIKMIKPGINPLDLYNYRKQRFAEMGFAAEYARMEEFGFVFDGHGIGLSVHEPPVLDYRSNDPLPASVTMAIEGNLFDQVPFAKTNIALKNEENILITDQGCELLTTIPNDLYISTR